MFYLILWKTDKAQCNGVEKDVNTNFIIMKHRGINTNWTMGTPEQGRRQEQYTGKQDNKG